MPVLEEDTLVLPESVVIMEYLEERFPDPALLPEDPAARAIERLWIDRFDDRIGRDYYAFRRGDENALDERLRAFEPPAVRPCRDRLPAVDHPREGHARRRAATARGRVAHGALAAPGRSRGARRRRGVMNVEAEELANRLSDPAADGAGRSQRGGVRRIGRRRVRSEAGSHPGARNLDIGVLARCETVEQVQEVVGLPAGAEIVAYCHSGSRSALAVQILRAAGYEARNYAGSWHEWSRLEGSPLET